MAALRQPAPTREFMFFARKTKVLNIFPACVIISLVNTLVSERGAEVKDEKGAKRKIFSIAAGAVLVLLFTVGCVLLWDKILYLGTDEGRQMLRESIDGIGFPGWLATLGIQVVQIIIAVLPGEPVELMLGFMWGPWLGTVTCLLGIFIGTALIFLLVRTLGKPFVSLVVGEEGTRRYRFLSDPVKLDITVFILFFIPGTPKDVLTYIVPLTGMMPLKYLVVATVARIPSVLTSTVLGDSVMRGDYAMAIGVFVLTALISVGGIIFGGLYVKRKQTDSDVQAQKEISDK